MRGKAIEVAVTAWDRAVDRPAIAAAATERERVRELFPIDLWPTLPLDRYALGTGIGDAFCKVMEFNTPALGGIGGGSAKKHLIYRKSDGTWYHRAEYANEIEAWDAVRGGFVRGFGLAQAGEWAEIDAIPAIANASSLRGKTFSVYFPEESIPIFSTGYQNHYYKLLGGEGPISDGVGATHALWQAAQATGLFEGWNPIDIARFLWAWSDPKPGTRIVKIAPGHNGKFWDECRQGGYICVGWDEVGDLKEFESKEEFRRAFGEAYPDYSPGKATEKANEVWTLMELQPGDIVLANQGTGNILGQGQVTDPGYVWRPDRGEWAFHTVAIDWEAKEPWRIEPIKHWGMTTVSNVSPDQYKRILQGLIDGAGNGGGGVVDIPPDPLLAELATTISRKGQVVLYGPPGTGKTYNARRFSVWWLSAQGNSEESKRVLGDADVFRSAEARLSASDTDENIGQLTRVTFHPSYTYEDFVEGYKPVPTGTGQLDLRMTDGVFKRVCRAAQADTDRPYLLLIDEVNRGNIPKIFGELITLLEFDKREMTVVLPQSRETFSVPRNVFLLGTMNTADRSIKLLDAALRRRFAFIELMPDTKPLGGGKVGDLDLALFLTGLNSKIAATEGREKQIGHSFLLTDTGDPVTSHAEFAQRFRYEILPLLQEYAYEDYAELESYIGSRLVDVREQSVNADILATPEDLVDALRAQFQPTPTREDQEIGAPEESTATEATDAAQVS